ncbi:MAG: histidine phosphatase family protein, partial [Patescibacteria group bacterium]
MITIIFEAHATTVDNEADLASGWNDPELSEHGMREAREMGMRYAENAPAAVFCSDLERARRTAGIAFGTSVPIITDPRLREINYGTYTGLSSRKLQPLKQRHIRIPFPGGESYLESTERMRTFLAGIPTVYGGRTIVIIGHRATQYGLEALLRGKTLSDAVSEPWTWQPGWKCIGSDTYCTPWVSNDLWA